jgi:hypothetical protein
LRHQALQADYIYYWDESSNIGYLTPSVDSRIKLAGAIWEMRGEDLGRVQIKELMEAATRGGAIDVIELGAIKQRILNPSSGVSFTPRKKPLYSDDSWEFAGGGLEVLPVIEEAPDPLDLAVLQEHIGRQWSTVIIAVATLKSVAGRNNKYELELDALGTGINSLRAVISRLTTLVGSPVDGLSFNLYGIMDCNEDTVMELDH